MARDHQGIRAQSVCVGGGGGEGVSTFPAFPLFLPNSVSVGLLTIASLEAMPTLLWQPKGTLPVPPQGHPHAYSKGYSEWPLFCSWERTTQPPCLWAQREMHSGDHL